MDSVFKDNNNPNTPKAGNAAQGPTGTGMTISGGKNDTVMIQYVGWRPTGETFFNTRTKGQPMPMALNSAAPGFTEALQLMKKGEKAFLWIPAEIGFRNKPAAGANNDMMAYEVELIDIQPAPAIPADVAGPDAKAKGLEKSKSGISSIPLNPPKDAKSDAVRPWDNAVFNYTAWDATGRMIESSEVRKRPATAAPFKQPPGLGEALTGMKVGERKRFWIPSTMLRKNPNTPDGLVCYEIELMDLQKQTDPPPVPKDVAKPPADAKKSTKGVFYKILTKGTGTAHPQATETVKVNYTGWTTDGKMFDSSVTRGQPAEFSLSGVIAGWTDGMQELVVGDKARFWIPEELAYKGAPGKPQGMLVFDIDLLDIKPPSVHPPGMPGMPGHGGMGPGGRPGMPGMPGHPPGAPGAPGAPMTIPAPAPAPAPATTH